MAGSDIFSLLTHIYFFSFFFLKKCKVGVFIYAFSWAFKVIVQSYVHLKFY